MGSSATDLTPDRQALADQWWNSLSEDQRVEIRGLTDVGIPQWVFESLTAAGLWAMGAGMVNASADGDVYVMQAWLRSYIDAQ